jgi:lipid-binding SYLF domain-containing protein
MKRQHPKGESMKRWIWLLGAVFALAPLAQASDIDKIRERILNTDTILAEALNVPEGVPRDLLDKARCVIVMPSVVKAAFILGTSYGRGAMVCRTGNDFSGPWGPPAMYALEGGSIGFQIGGQATDFIFLVMNDRGAQSLLNSKVRIGGDISGAAGPIGRTATADTDVYLRAQILSYSRSRGVFAGVSLAGSTLRPDNDANRLLYGRRAEASEIIQGTELTAPVAAHALLARLQEASPNLEHS